MSPRDAYAGTHYRMPLRRRVRRFFRAWLIFFGSDRCQL